MARALLQWLDIDAFVAWLYAPSLVLYDRSCELTRPREKAKRAANHEQS